MMPIPNAADADAVLPVLYRYSAGIPKSRQKRREGHVRDDLRILSDSLAVWQVKNEERKTSFSTFTVNYFPSNHPSLLLAVSSGSDAGISRKIRSIQQQ